MIKANFTETERAGWLYNVELTRTMCVIYSRKKGAQIDKLHKIICMWTSEFDCGRYI